MRDKAEKTAGCFVLGIIILYVVAGVILLAVVPSPAVQDFVGALQQDRTIKGTQMP